MEVNTRYTTRMKRSLAALSPPDAVDRLAPLGESVCKAFEAILEPMGGNSVRPTDLAAALGIHVSIASRLLKALRIPDRIAAIGLLPGTEALRSMVAPGGSVPEGAARDARRAIGKLDEFVRMELGGRDGLAAFLSEAVPDQREGFELGHKRAAHRAMSHLMGISAEYDALTLLVWPNEEDQSRLNALNLHTVRGVKQKRPGSSLNFVHQFFSPGEDTTTPLTINGTEPEDALSYVVWEKTSIPPERATTRTLDAAHVLSFDVGPMPGNGYDLTLATFQVGAHFATPRTPGRSSGIGLTVSVPARRGMVEVLMPPGVWSGRTAKVLTHMLGPRGGVDPNDPVRIVDEFRVTEKLEQISWSQLRIAELPDHPGLVGFACKTMGLDSATLSGFRVRSNYPVVGTQLSIEILPE